MDPESPKTATAMNLEELRKILEIVREHEVTEFELEQEGLKLRVKKNGVALVASPISSPPAPAPEAVGSGQGRAVPSAPVAVGLPGSAPEGTPEMELDVVKSPIVGTFYRAPEPSAPPFAEVGAIVKKGQVLCIIEAMKLMNEIESEYDGEVVNVYVENGQPVQYGERLFAIRTQ
jgi:acetyl-CoA carboxylase biotin carboxyl carrier protein